jgi:hypothetical protein
VFIEKVGWGPVVSRAQGLLRDGPARLAWAGGAERERGAVSRESQ